MIRRKQRGTTLVELLFVLAILGVLLGILSKFFIDARAGLIASENDTDLAAMSKITSTNLTISVGQSERLLADFTLSDGTGADVFGNFRTAVLKGISASATGAPLPVTWTITPRIHTYAHVTYEAACPCPPATGIFMGNSLLYVAALPPEVMKSVTSYPTVPTPIPPVGTSPTPTPIPTYTPVPSTKTPMVDISLDRYQLVYVYLTLDTKRRIGNTGLPGRLRLVEWRSKPFVSYSQLQTTVGVASNLLLYMSQRLQSLGYNYAFDLNANDGFTAFHAINPASTPILNPVGVSQTPMAEDSWAYVDEYRSSQVVDPDPLLPAGHISKMSFNGGLMGNSFYSVAYNTWGGAPATMKINSLTGTERRGFLVPQFTLPSATTPFPAGFEVSISGSRPGSREVWIRTVYMAISAAKPLAEKNFLGSESQVSVTIKNPE